MRMDNVGARRKDLLRNGSLAYEKLVALLVSRSQPAMAPIYIALPYGSDDT